jgi:glycosyltransferase involved in cell wall biosynthesis
MNSYRIHLLALPNVQTTRAYSLDGFCMATIRFARMMKDLGHTVILYASEENEAPCDELVTVITKEEQVTFLAGLKGDPTPYQYAFIEEWSPLWQLASGRMIREIAKRKQPRDFLCTIGGASQKAIADAHPDLMCVEYSIGYNASFSPYRVFESYAWKHVTYGIQGIQDGRFFDAVIPCFYDEDEFPFRAEKESFALYVGRLIPRKGIHIACQAAHATGVPLKVIGHGDQNLVTDGAEYLGALGMDERNEWMARAQVVLTPTIYIEPFNQVAVEAQLCGTPVIATDWGGFTETIEPGLSGFRCHVLGDFMRAIHEAAFLDPATIRARAIQKYSLHHVKHEYQRYFDRLMLLWKDGWNSVQTYGEAVGA